MRPRHRSSPDRRRPSPGRRSRMSGENGGGPTPICRCRVLYLGSAVPHVTKDGLQGIQEPLRELYPEEGALGAKGIDSWLSVWSNGFLLENVDENRKRVTRFFPIEALHYCAAVRYVLVPAGGNGEQQQQRFLPLDSPFARTPSLSHPPLFAAILRRTTGIKVLECHVFICKRETAANALVRCAFHAYADSTYAKHLESGASLYGTIGAGAGGAQTPIGATGVMVMGPETPTSVIEVSEDSIDSIEKVEEWKVLANGQHKKRMVNGTPSPRENGNGTSPDEISVVNGDDNHKVWPGKVSEPAGTSPNEGLYDYGSTLRSFRSSASGLSHRNRPRQMMMPSSPPPPPIPEELRSTEESGKKEKGKKRRSKSRDNVDMNGDVPSRVNGGSSGSRKQSVGSLPPPPPPMRHMNGHGPPRGGAPPMMPPHVKKSGTFSARGSKRGMPPPFVMYGPPPIGPFGPMPPPGLMPPPGHPLYGTALEEPIYMPHSARPLSPVASYQPGHFPHEAYYSNYATIDKSNKYRKKGKVHASSDSNAESDLNAGIYRVLTIELDKNLRPS